MRRAVLVLALVGSACGIGTTTPTTIPLDVQTFDELAPSVLAADEINAIVAGDAPGPDFNSDPATSGPHADAWARCGFYRQEIPDIYLVHSLRRGAVVIHYSPRLEPADIDAVAALVRALDGGVVAAPRSGLPAPVVLAAWTTLLEVDEIDDTTLRAFVDTYAPLAPDSSSCPLEIDES